jgi:hypothetical protein
MIARWQQCGDHVLDDDNDVIDGEREYFHVM